MVRWAVTLFWLSSAQGAILHRVTTDAMAPKLVPGYRLDRYELLCPIATGGMASVWVAKMVRQHGFEKLVAIKTILPQYATDKSFRDMFLAEARIASRIEHPNVAQILDLGEESGILFLAMEYVDGEMLLKLHTTADSQKERIPIGVVLRLMAETCAGLHAAHELCDATGAPLGVVHRDVSPQNILVNTQGTAKLIDFGVAKAQGSMTEDTSAGTFKGKVQYMAPEQARGEQVDRRTDIWSVGAVMYFLLSGKQSCEAPNEIAALVRLIHGTPPDPLPTSVPQCVANVVAKALSRDRMARFATAESMQEAIERAMFDAGVETSVKDVAEYAGIILGDCAKRRQKTLELAQTAATERMQLRLQTTTLEPFQSTYSHQRPEVEATKHASEDFDAPRSPQESVIGADGRLRGSRTWLAAIGLCCGVLGLVALLAWAKGRHSEIKPRESLQVGPGNAASAGLAWDNSQDADAETVAAGGVTSDLGVVAGSANLAPAAASSGLENTLKHPKEAAKAKGGASQRATQRVPATATSRQSAAPRGTIDDGF